MSDHTVTPSPPLLTQRQIRRLQSLPEDHKVVGAKEGAPIVQRPDGQMLRVQPNGRLAATTMIERVQSYLHVPIG